MVARTGVMILVLACSCPALVAQLPASSQTGDTGPRSVASRRGTH